MTLNGFLVFMALIGGPTICALIILIKGQEQQ